jgi:hypothetical protein
MPETTRQKKDRRTVDRDEPVQNEVATQVTTSLKRRSLGFSNADAEAIELVSKVYGISTNDAVRKSIAIAAHLIKERQSGGRVLIQDEDKSIRELVFLP